jgi:oligo-1,6-glucosidase
VVEGDFTMLLPDDEQLYAYTRSLDGTELLVIGNFSGEPASAAGIPSADVWAASELVLTNAAAPGPDLVLGPWQAVVYRRRVSR